ncbi:MAG: SRPBCC family protein [Actinobacteria bacterium]|nr:SRPBCC family protein [Actinomycetota bacterium]
MPRRVHVRGATSAPPDAVHALLVDVSTWSVWGPWVSAVLESTDPSGGGGAGAVRRLESRAFGRTVVSREEVLEVLPGRGITYGLLSGLPLRDYRGVVTVEPDGRGGSTITWSSTFEPRVRGTGWFYRAVLQKFVTDLVPALGRAAAGSTMSA